MKNRILSLLLVLFLCVGIFAGCQSSALKSYSDETENPAAQNPETEGKDYDPVFASFAPDTVMYTINGLDVTWQELFYWYYIDVTGIESYYGEITDWDAPCAFDESQSYREFIMNDALELTKRYHVLESKGIDTGVMLTGAEMAEVEAIWQSNVEGYGGTEEDFLNYLASEYVSRELFDYFAKIQALYTPLLAELYGANGEKLGEEEVIAEAESRDLVRAKHILLKTIDDNYESLGDDVKAEKLAEAQAVLAELQAITDPAALEARIDELIVEVSEDTGSLFYTDGYTFGPGEMDEAFQNAAYALENYGLSGIVEGFYGYHIIMRLPLKSTALMMDSTTLAYMMSQYIFSKSMEAWSNECVVSYSLMYLDMDIAALFAKAK